MSICLRVAPRFQCLILTGSDHSTNGSLVIRMVLPTNAAPPQEHPEEWAQQEFERRLRSGAHGTGVCKDTGLVTVGVSLSYADSYSDLARQDSVAAMGRTVKNPRSVDLKEMVAALGSEWDQTAVQQAAATQFRPDSPKSDLSTAHIQLHGAVFPSSLPARHSQCSPQS